MKLKPRIQIFFFPVSALNLRAPDQTQLSITGLTAMLPAQVAADPGTRGRVPDDP